MSSMFQVHRFRKYLLTTAGAVAVVAAAIPSSARARETAATAAPGTRARYNLPPAPLAATLHAIEQQSKSAVLFGKEDVSAVRSNPVVGEFTPSQAVVAAVAGTGLSVNVRLDGSILVGGTSRDNAEILVLGQRNEAETSFKASRSETATRSGASLLETPGSVTIITSKVLESQQSLNITDAMNNVSGLQVVGSQQGAPTINARGFGSTSLTVNGVNDSSAASTNIYAVERLEVLKGPQTILSGSDSFGGGVNVVTKKPAAETYRSLLLQIGSHADGTLAADSTGRITADGKLSYRLIGSAAKAANSQAGFNGRSDYSILPQLRFKSGGTDIIAGYSWSKQYDPLPKYTFALLNGEILNPPHALLGNKADGFRSKQQRIFYQIEHTFSPHITLISRLQYSESSLGIRVYNSQGLEYDDYSTQGAMNGFVDFNGNVSENHDRQFSGDHYLRITGKLGPTHHTLSVGFNHSHYRTVQDEYDAPAFISALLYPTAIAAEFPDLTDSFKAPPISRYLQTTDQLSGFAQDLITWGKFNFSLNARTTHYESKSSNSYTYPGGSGSYEGPKQKKTHTTPGAGIVYRITPALSIYGSYSQGFSPQFLNSCGGSGIPPQETENLEAGVKADLFNGKFSATGDVFKLKMSNQLQYNSNSDCYTTLSGQVTRGAELDLQGEITRGWNLIANYTYNSYKDASYQDRVFAGMPRHKASLWTTYNFPNGRLQGFGMGFGVTATSRYDGNTDPSFPFKIPTQARVDLSLLYDNKPWNITLGIKNLMNKKLYGTAIANSYVPISERLTVLFSMKRRLQ